MIDPSGTGRHRRHADMAWTSFDRFGRYARVAELLAGVDDAGPVVDIGDRSGYLRRFLPSVASIAFDPGVENDRFDDAVVGVADGTRLPLADGAAPAAVSCDVLEHVPAAVRPSFVRELLRVARHTVVITAPFDTIGVAATEELVARFTSVLHGEPQPQLAEHAENGLPDLEATVAVIAAAGWDVHVEGEGNLYDWLSLMLLRLGNESNDSLRPLSDGIDILYNNMFSARSTTPPFYRHILSATPGTGVVTGLDEALNPESISTDAVGAALLSKVMLIDLVPQLQAFESKTAQRLAEYHIDVTGRIDQQRLELLEGQRRLEARLDRWTPRRVWAKLKSVVRSTPANPSDGAP